MYIRLTSQGIRTYVMTHVPVAPQHFWTERAANNLVMAESSCAIVDRFGDSAINVWDPSVEKMRSLPTGVTIHRYVLLWTV